MYEIHVNGRMAISLLGITHSHSWKSAFGLATTLTFDK